ncbi:MAG: Lrp/AsnC family transcriptional regulator [archaeon]
MKQSDLLIISNLRLNARESLTSMSRKTRIPVSTIFDKLRENVNGIIKRSTVLLDFHKLGFPTVSTILMKVSKENREQLKEHLQKSFNVNSFYKVNNGYDFIIEVVFRTMQEQESFIEKLEESYNVLDLKTFFIIEELKKEEFFSNPKTIYPEF